MVRKGTGRVGTLTAGGTGYSLRLAGWRPTPYRPMYRPVWPEYQDIPGTNKVAGDPQVRQWHINEFTGGEGNELWKPGEAKYDKGYGTRPNPYGEALILGSWEDTSDDDSPAEFTENGVLGLAQGKLWAGLDATVHWWQESTEDWDATGWATGGSTNEMTCIVDADDGTNLLIGYDNNTVRKVSSGANSQLATGFTYDPLMVNFGGVIYLLDGDDLYTIDTSTGATTQVSDIDGRSNDYLTNNVKYTYNRLAASDRGPIWYQVMDNGQVFIWEYNVASDTTERLGMLPVDRAYPYSIFFAHGFVFVGFRYASDHDQEGEAFLYYQRASQRGVAGPFRNTSSSTASIPVLIAGMIGDELIVYWDGDLHGYNLTTGGIVEVAQGITSWETLVYDALTFGKDVFVCADVGTGADPRIEWVDTTAYTASGSWYSGRYDMGYAGISKILLDVTVVTDPLPANTSVSLKVSANGAAFATVTGTHETDNATAYTWTVSSASSAVTGEDFEIRLDLATTASGSTPTVRSVTARAISGEKQRMWLLELDAGTHPAGIEGASPRSSDVLADLKTLAEYGGLMTFSNPWDGEDWDTPGSYTVRLEDAELLPADTDDPGDVIRVLLREAAYV